MADPENIGIAVGIALLLSVETEIIVLQHPLPVYGRHLEFVTFVHLRKCPGNFVEFAVSQSNKNVAWLV